MKRFLCQILVFLLALVIFYSIPLLLFEKKAKECTNREPYMNINKVTRLEHVDADVIILGNSRAECAFDSSLMTSLSGLKYLNLAWGGHAFDFCYHVMYKTYIKHNKKPNYIIVEVSPRTFFEHTSSLYCIELLPYINRPEFQFYVDMCPQLSKADRMLFIRYFGKLRKVIKEIGCFDNPVIQKPKKHKWRKNYYKKPQRLECNPSIIQLFDSFLDECLADGIKVILVCSPMHIEDGLNYFDVNGFWRIVKKCVSGTKFPVISYQNYFGNDTVYFSDPIHLNSYGKEVFSTKLIHDLDSLGIININTNDLENEYR